MTNSEFTHPKIDISEALAMVSESFTIKNDQGKVIHVSFSENDAKKKAEQLSKETGKPHTHGYDREAYVKTEGVKVAEGTLPRPGEQHTIDWDGKSRVHVMDVVGDHVHLIRLNRPKVGRSQPVRDEDEIIMHKDEFHKAKLGEGVEPISELSTELLAKYKKKSAEASSAADKEGKTELANKRYRGIIKATKKQFATKVSEEVNLEEAAKPTVIAHFSSKDGYGNEHHYKAYKRADGKHSFEISNQHGYNKSPGAIFVSGSNTDAANHTKNVEKHVMSGDLVKANSYLEKHTGTKWKSHAISESEQIDELSISTMTSYLDKAKTRVKTGEYYKPGEGMKYHDSTGKDVSKEEHLRKSANDYQGRARAQEKIRKAWAKVPRKQTAQPSQADSDEQGRHIQKQYYSGKPGSRNSGD